MILQVASLKPNKGHAVALDALARITPYRPGIRYFAAGNKDGLWSGYAQTLERQIPQMGLEPHATLLGHISDEELADAYAAADIVIVPSLAETFPLAVLDAMAWGKPVVATDVGGVAHMIDDGETGRLIPAGDSSALADALLVLAKDANERARLGARAAECVMSRFSWEQVIGRYGEICCRLIAPSQRMLGQESVE